MDRRFMVNAANVVQVFPLVDQCQPAATIMVDWTPFYTPKPRMLEGNWKAETFTDDEAAGPTTLFKNPNGKQAMHTALQRVDRILTALRIPHFIRWEWTDPEVA